MTQNTDPCPQRSNAAGTPLQEQLLRLYSVLADVRQLDERTQGAFASIATKAIVYSLGGPMIVDEATDYLRAA